MIPERLHLGGHENFNAYQQRFRSEYIDGPPLHEARGKLVKFHEPKGNGEHDCAHAIYGTPQSKWYKPEHWNQERAERILWIRSALTENTITIHECHDAPQGRRRLLYLFVAMDDDRARPYEYHCVLADTLPSDPESLYFLTAYDLKKSDWEAKKKKYKCIFKNGHEVAQQTKAPKKKKAHPKVRFFPDELRSAVIIFSAVLTRTGRCFSSYRPESPFEHPLPRRAVCWCALKVRTVLQPARGGPLISRHHVKLELIVLIYPLTIYRFALSKSNIILSTRPTTTDNSRR